MKPFAATAVETAPVALAGQTPPAASGQAVFWLVATTFFWGGSFVFNKIGFREIPPVLFLFLRFSLAVLLLLPFCARRFRRLDRKTVRNGVVVGLALAAANLFFVLGLSGTTVSRAAFLNNLFVLVIPILSFLFWRARVSRELLLAVAAAVLGLWLLARGGTEGFNRGDLISVVCAVFIALHVIAVSRILRDEDILLVTFIQFVTVAAVGGLLVAVLRPSVGAVGVTSLGALAYCAVFPTIVCFTLQNTYQRFVTPTRAGLIYTLDPVWSTLGGVFLLGERLSGREWLGCALILAAVAGPFLAAVLAERKGRVVPALR
jgi:drug/metabolite transporter (DMT)-like permease